MIASVTVHVNPNLPWYIARSSGIVAWALVTASVIWGLAFSGKLTRHPKLPSAAWMLDLHRFLGGMAVIFTGFHIAGLMMDKFVGYGPAQIAVPFTSVYRPVATAWGIIGCYLLLSIELTSLVMSRRPRRIWHGIHLTSFGVFALVTVHGLSTGTDARHGVLPLGMVLAAIVVAMLTGMRAQIAITKRAERAARAQRTGRAAPGTRSVRAGTRPVHQPAVAWDEEDELVDAWPGRAPERPRPVRPVVELGRTTPLLELPGPAVDAPDAPLRPRPAQRAVERTKGPMVPATGPGDRSIAPCDDRDEQFRVPAPTLESDPSLPMPGPSGDRRSALSPYADPRFAPGPRADPRFAPGPRAGPTSGMHRVSADGRGADEHLLALERPVAADGRGGVPRRTPADGRPAEDSDMPAGRLARRLP